MAEVQLHTNLSQNNNVLDFYTNICKNKENKLGGGIVIHEIPLSENQKAFLANGIFRAVTQDMPELIYENELPTAVGSGLFRWNFINRNLSNGLNGEFQVSFQKRGAWKFLLLYDSITNFSVSVMTEQNLKKLQRHPTLHPHYLEALVSNNQNRVPIEGQLCLEEMMVERDFSILSELRNQLLSSFSGIIGEHLLILFDYNYTGVTSARAVLLTPTLEIAVSDDWAKYLKSKHIPKGSPLMSIVSDDEPIVKLKDKYINKENDLTALHENDSETSRTAEK